MEVFLAYTKDDIYSILEQTANAWAECDDAEVVLLEVKNESKFEIQRRVMADNLSKGRYYVLTDVGCLPEAPDTIRQIERKPKVSLAGLWPSDMPADDVPVGVRVCEKGVVRKWVAKRAPSYDHEHAESVRLSGKTVEIWTDISFQHVQAC